MAPPLLEFHYATNKENFVKLVFGELLKFESVKRVIKEILDKIKLWEKDYRKEVK